MEALRHGHDRLRTAVRNYSAVLSRRPDDVRAALLDRRVGFSQLFTAHVRAERAAMRALASDTLGKAHADALARL